MKNASTRSTGWSENVSMKITKRRAGEVYPKNLLSQRRKENIMAKKDKYNSSGYLDMTAYLAIRNVEREEKTAREKAKIAAKKKKRSYIKGRGKKNSGGKL